MKKLVIAALAASSFIATPAFAETSDQESFVINASVPGTCTIGNPGTFDMGELSVVTTAGQANTLTLAALGTNGVRKTQDFWVSCNDVNRMTLTSANNGKLIRDGAAPTAEEAAQGFTNQISYAVGATNYRPNVDIFQQPALSNGTPFFQNQTRGAIHQEVGMRVLIRPTDGNNATRRPLAGDYSDTVTVTVQIAA